MQSLGALPVSNKVVTFPLTSGVTSQIAQFIRIGSAHRKVSELVAAGRLPASRFVVEASRAHAQKSLIAELHDRGAEVVLDPLVAELSAIGRIQSQARHAPWAIHGNGKPLSPDQFAPNSSDDIIGAIARMAVEMKFDVVLAPTHFLADPNFSEWLGVDRKACIALREALDREGGEDISIDYPIIHSHTKLQGTDVKSELLSGLPDLPFDNLWIRASGAEALGGPLAIRRYIDAMASLHNLGKPIIADYFHGLTSTTAIAFGALSGKAHGIGEQERFDARAWQKPVVRDDSGGFGRTVRIGVPGLGRTLTGPELTVLTRARGGRKLVACGDRNCCSNGLQDMLENPRRHAAHQAIAEVARLNEVPDQNRAEHFLNNDLKHTARLARDVKRLKPPASDVSEQNVNLESLMKRLGDHSKKLDKVEEALEDYLSTRAKSIPNVAPVAEVRSKLEPEKQKKT